MELPTRSRRIGERLNVHGIVLSWNTGGRRTPKWKRRPFDEADVVDVSISGAQLLAPDDGKVQVGDTVTIVAGGAIGSVIVRRIVPISQGGLAVFGVEFLLLDGALESLLFAALQQAGRPADDVVWR